ncbi:MAG: CatB-related O-acetyltransferase [Opitutaceae bacterium]
MVGHLSTIGGSTLGRGCLIERKVELFGCALAEHVAVQPKCVLTKSSIGRYSYVGRETSLNEVNIGSFASIGPRTSLGYGEHPSHLISTAPIFYSTRRQCGMTFAAADHFAERKPIVLGHDVWLGAHVFVRDGVTIGHGAIVAAGSVVTKDVPPYAIVGGVPAKLIRFRFSEDEIARMLALRWWDWDEQRLRASQPWFVQTDVAAFLKNTGA